MTNDISRLAIEIADEAAAMDINAYCIKTTIDNRAWLNTQRSKYSADDLAVIARATRYLDARGMLARHAQNRNLVALDAGGRHAH
ncbi:hypothetical protein [Paralcaligenes ginsengisoli]